LDIAGLVNPETINGHRTVMVGVKLQSMDLVNKGKEFSKLRGIVSVSVVTGRFDKNTNWKKLKEERYERTK